MKRASRSVAWERVIPLAALLLLSLLAAGPLWGPGLLNTRGGGDSPFLLLRTHQLAANLRAGAFPVRWMPDAAYGFGYPFFSYYAALPYYLAAGLALLGLDVLSAIKLTQTLFLAAAALAMYGWAESVLRSRAGAWLAAVAYTVAPFHLINLYVRGDSLSEFAAFAFYPTILWALDRLAAQPSIRRGVVPALAYAGLILTHNVSALIFTPFILLYVAIHVARTAVLGSEQARQGTVSRYSAVALSLLTGLLLSAWFWFPALAETDYVQLEAQTTGYFFYGNHFRGTDLVQRGALFNYATAQETGSPFAMGLVQATMALAGVLIVILRWVRSWLPEGGGKVGVLKPQVRIRHLGMPELGFGLVGLILTTWLVTPLSQPLWDRLPLLPMIQFPWRFLSIQALFTALFTGAIISHIGNQRRDQAWVVALLMGVLVTTTALLGLTPDYLPVTADEITAERLQLYEVFTGNIGSTIRHEYLPTWVNPRPYIGPEQVSPHSPPRAIAISGALLSAERLDRQPTRRAWHVETGGQGSEVAFPLYYWPGWYAAVDGTNVDVEPATGSGYLSLDIPPGRHVVELRLGRTPVRLGAEVVSLATALTMLVFFLGEWKQENQGGEQAHRSPYAGKLGSAIRTQEAAISGLPFFVLLSLMMAFHPRLTVTRSHDLTMDFAEMPYLHHNPHGVPLDGWRLTSYSYGNLQSVPTDETAPGDTLDVTIHWTRGADRPATVSGKGPMRIRLVPPAAVRHEELPAVAEDTIELNQQGATPDAAVSTTASLAVPKRTAPGMYLLQITHTPPVYLRPIWIDSEQVSAEEGVRATFADGALRLHDVQATQTASDHLRVQLDWSAVKPVAANYGLSLRLTDTAGNEWFHQDGRPGYDTQPGHGFLPTSLWPLNRTITDHHVPSLRPGAAPADSYTLAINLYQVTSWRSMGQFTTTVSLTQAWERQDPPVLARFGQGLVLSQLEIRRSVWQGETLTATAYWSVLEQLLEDYVVRWQLEGESDCVTSRAPLAPGSSPTEWPRGAWVAGQTALRIPPTAPPGDYSVTLTVEEPLERTPIDSYTLPTPLEIRGRDRVWELPEMDHKVGARFGGSIELAGYDLTQRTGSLALTLHWRALTTLDHDYVFFVHLADPGTGEPASQVDTMPQGYDYPTSQWAPGEVISDRVELPTRGVESGRYDLAVGWYDPNTKERLQTVTSEGAAVPENRLLLPTSVMLP